VLIAGNRQTKAAAFDHGALYAGSSALVGRTGDDVMHYFDYITIGIALALAVSLIAAYAFGSLPLPP
jgi:hypothetical protein